MTLELRAARHEDYAHFAGLFPYLESGDATPDEERWQREMRAHTSLAVDEGGAALGLCFAHPLRSSGYVRFLVVYPRARRCGVARALMEQQRERFRAMGLARWRLNVKQDNAPARALYEALGMRPRHENVALQFDYAQVAALCARDEALTVRPLGADEDRDAERQFDLIEGTLEDARQRGGRLFFAVEEPSGARVGVCVFDPRFPGSFGFRARTLGTARALIEAIEPHAPVGSRMNLVVEGDAPLVESLVRMGATTRTKLYHYEGMLDAP